MGYTSVASVIHCRQGLTNIIQDYSPEGSVTQLHECIVFWKTPLFSERKYTLLGSKTAGQGAGTMKAYRRKPTIERREWVYSTWTHKIALAGEVTKQQKNMLLSTKTYNCYQQRNILSHTHIHCFNEHFPGESGLAGCPLDNKGWWCEFLWVQCCSSHPSNSAKALKDWTIFFIWTWIARLLYTVHYS